ncbi:uncharacterized protein LOC106875294 [Octopus bimaculoides]|uniref:Uncharacterized protein n=1 Tax=Octopus bimaculoides TaxID=37653 RepID=A0A0L8GRA6_OCTBM|nr:uncharacterized protein LOC106875294 [Octopus bimaculoides]|eukprot:XP_014778870.1 PREDICTED: uncharacterized protein LOC106875294 [Octopus bimaculoides]
MMIPLLFILSTVAISPVAGGISAAAVEAGIETADMVVKQAREMWVHSRTSEIMKTDHIPYHCSLAASFSNLTSETVKAMDEELQIIIAATNRVLAKARKDNRGRNMTFDDYVYLMKQNVALRSDNGEDVIRSRYKGYNQIRFAQNSVDEEIVNEIIEWFKNEVVVDPDVLAATKIDIVDFGNFVAATGAALDSLAALFVKRDYAERSVVDLGIIRYPDLDHPYFKLFRIQLFAYRKNARILVVQRDESGIKGQFESKIFRPNKTVLNRMQDSVRQKAMKEAQEAFQS